MIPVVCFMMGFSQPGLLVEQRGANWLVQFSTVTKEVNANSCLIKKG